MSTFAVVIVAFRSADVIGEVVRSAFDLPDVGTVVVVDNGDDGSADIAAREGAHVLRRPDNPGFGSAQNMGVAACREPFVLLLNPDAVPVAAGIWAGLQALAHSADVGAVQGRIVNRATGAAERSHGIELGPMHLWGRALGARRIARWSAIRWIARRTLLRDHVDRTVTRESTVESIAATAVLVRRSAFDMVGGFDERFFLYGEDLDLCRRLRASGWRLVALPDLFAYHDSGGSSPNWWSRELEWWRGTMTFAARWWSSPRWVSARLASVVRWLGLVLVRPEGAVVAWRKVVASAQQARADRVRSV